MAKRTKKYTRWSRRIERNIIACYARATPEEREEGFRWYANAHEHARVLASKYRVTTRQACGVVAALSPGSEWGRNLLDAEALIKAWAKEEPIPNVGTYGRRNIDKALRILNGDEPLDVLPETGPKVRAFFVCIASPRDAVTVCIDRHAKCLALDVREDRDKNSVVRAGREYRYFAKHYQRIADRYGILPHQLQAVTWVTWKRLIEQNDEIPF